VVADLGLQWSLCRNIPTSFATTAIPVTATAVGTPVHLQQREELERLVQVH
jgi:hypothetical protein